MWNIFNTLRRSQFRRRRRHWGRASKSPTLATIPEATTAGVEVSPFHLDEHPRRHLSKQRRENRHLRHSHLQLCLLILAPGHMILTSLLLLHPLLHPSIRSHTYLRPQKHRYHESKQASTGDKGSGTNPNRTPGSRMSKKRVVTLSFDNEKVYMNLDAMLGKMTETTIEGIASHSIDNDSSSQTSTLPHKHESDDSINHSSNSHSTECTPMAKWQTMSFPTCNSLHELNIFSSSSTLSFFDPRRRKEDVPRFHRFRENKVIDEHMFPISDTYSAKLLKNGWFRHAWEVADASRGTSVAIKTLR